MVSRRARFLSPLVIAGMILAGLLAPVSGRAADPVSLDFADGATIDVFVTGVAEAPASGAIVQLSFYQSFASYGEMDPYASPEAQAFTESAVSQDQLDAITAAIVGAGIAVSRVAAQVVPVISAMSMGGPGSAIVAFELDAGELDRIDELTTIARNAGAATGASIGMAGVAYTVADCSGIEEAALGDAMANAQTRAEGTAVALGIKLGGIVKIVVTGAYGPYYASGPSSGPCDFNITLKDALTIQIQSYDQPSDGRVRFYAQVTVSYLIA